MFFHSLTSAGDVLENLRESWRISENLGESQRILENLRESQRILENLGGGKGGVNSFLCVGMGVCKTPIQCN